MKSTLFKAQQGELPPLKGRPLKTKTTTVAGEEISYAEAVSSNDLPALVFLPGFGSEASYYMAIQEELACKYHVIAPNLYGIYHSQRSAKSFADYLQLTEKLLEQLEIQQYQVVGHSFGANIALHLGEQKSKIQKIIALNPIIKNSLKETLGHQLRLALSGGNFAKSEVFNLFANPEVGLGYMRNLFKNPLAYVQEAASAYSNVLPKEPVAKHVSVKLLFSENDGLFDFNEQFKEDFRQIYADIAFFNVGDYSHNWPIYFPEMARDLIESLLHS